MNESLKVSDQCSICPYPILFEELIRVEKLTYEETGHSFSFSDGSAGSIQWNLTGLRAGLFLVQTGPGRFQDLSLRFNRGIIELIGEESFRPTVAHEYAHAVVYHIRLKSRGKHSKEDIRPHGTIWQTLMHLYGHDSKRCHDYPVTPARIRKIFEYRCTGCHHEYRLGIVRHKRLLKNPGYLVCGRCRSRLYFEKEQS